MAARKTVLFSSKSRKKAEAQNDHPQKKKPKAKKRITIAASILIFLVCLYSVAVFTDIPFIKKWRDIYIETAMDTLNHKWLATFFIPESVINNVMDEQQDIFNKQQGLLSTWGKQASSGYSFSNINTEAAFLKEFKEVDRKSFTDYIKKNPDVLKNGYQHLLINKTGLSDTGTTIKTINGDQVVAVDVENGILIIKITGSGFVGKLAIVKDPTRVKVGVSATIGSSGQTVAQIADANEAVLAINASGFADYQATGNGGKVVGLLVSNGKKYNSSVKGTFLNIGFGLDNRLYIGASAADITYRDAVEFGPALIVNGDNVIEDKNLTKGSMGFGIQPRTAIGQTSDGTVLLMTVDGRKVGYSLGCFVTDCADILTKYGAVQAANLDGGSSTIMVYRGKEITDPADSTHYGRAVPDAFIVTYADGAVVAPSSSSGKPGTPTGIKGSKSSASTVSAKPTDSSSTHSPTPTATPEGSPTPTNTSDSTPGSSSDSSPSLDSSPDSSTDSSPSSSPADDSPMPSSQPDSISPDSSPTSGN
jgi:exopolysaccharide biosynthesis protein